MGQNGTRLFPFLPYAFALAAWLLLPARVPTLFHRLVCPQQVQQEEAVNVEFARILLRGDALYPDIREGGPYLHCSYPPLFPFLQSLLLRVLPGPWFPGRLLAFGGYLACGIMLGAAVWRRWRHPAWALSLPALLWLSRTWAMWGSMVRLDTLLLALNFGAFLILRSACEGLPKGRSPAAAPLAVAGILNAMAILLKPTAITLTLAFTVWALIRRPGKTAWAFGGCVAVPLGLFFAAAQWSTGGLYWLHTVVWAAVGFDARRLWGFLSGPFLREAGWLMVGVLLTVWRRPLPLLLKCQLLFSTLSLVSLSREGSAENYYMGFILYGLWTLAEGWATQPIARVRERKGIAWRYVLYGLLCLGLFFIARAPGLSLPSAAEMAAKLEMSRLYEGNGPQLALDADLPVMAGNQLWYQSSGIMPIARAGIWNPAPLVEDIHEKKFSTHSCPK